METIDDFYRAWNKLHIKYTHEGDTDYRNDKMADYCEEMIIKAKDSYYNNEEPIMSDINFDTFESHLKCLRPSSEVLQKVGSEIKEGKNYASNS